MKRKPFSKITLVLTSTLLTIALLTPMQAQASIQEVTRLATELDNKREAVQEKQHSKYSDKQKLTKEQMEQLKLRKLQKLAVFFDISTEGKTAEQLRAEIEAVKKENPEKWELFKQQFRAMKLEKLRSFAKEKGITIDGKTEEQLRKELHKFKKVE